VPHGCLPAERAEEEPGALVDPQRPAASLGRDDRAERVAAFRRSELPQTPQDWAEFQEVYAKANDRRLAWTEIEVCGGRFAATLAVPKDARGSCHIRVFVEGSEDFGLGAAETTAKPVALARDRGEATLR